MEHLDIGNRMKHNYENTSKTRLLRRTPVAIRLDGRAFHTFTRHLRKPFDDIFMKTMQETMRYLCSQIQGCVFGYTQSDEITLILIDYQELNTDAWFDYEVQKLCSISASLATYAFHKYFDIHTDNYFSMYADEDPAYENALYKACHTCAAFDARCFNIPKEEVANLIYWRQLDAKRNSVQMCGQAEFSQNELHEKTCEDIKAMLPYSWDNLPAAKKWGSACYRTKAEKWFVDFHMPLIKGENRKYVEQWVMLE